jgi:pimeloyl-ACP methyl ester carboxylesterase
MKIPPLALVCLLLGCSASTSSSPSAPPASSAPVESHALPTGKSSVVLPLLTGIRLNDTLPKKAEPLELECFTYKPALWDGRRMILVHHGVLRNADEYRDHAVPLGDRFNALIVAPRFDQKRFPSEKYQRGGIVHADGSPADPSEWTYALIPQIAQRLRSLESKPDMKFWIIGHSAGGQFAMRMSAFQDTGAERIVAANPGTDLFPTRDLPFGWGFGGLPESLSNDEQLKNYLAAPLTLYLGTADDHQDEDLDMSENSLKQGPGRLQRGRAAFALGEKTAREHGWPFAWRKVEAEGVPHDHEKMFAHSSCEEALFGPK